MSGDGAMELRVGKDGVVRHIGYRPPVLRLRPKSQRTCSSQMGLENEVTRCRKCGFMRWANLLMRLDLPLSGN